MRFRRIAALGAATLVACGEELTRPPIPFSLAGRIAFISDTGRYKLLHMRPDGSDVQPIPVEMAGLVADIDISPDGSHLALSISVGGPYEILSLRADGTEMTNLTNSPAESESSPRWTSDGSQIVFERMLYGASVDVLIMDADGRNRHVLLGTPAQELNASLSPDGETLVFALDTAAVLTGQSIIAILRLATGEQVELTELESPASGDQTPAWSPDGSRIAFRAMRLEERNSANLWVMNADGSDAHPVVSVDSLYGGGFPRWSPEGARIAFGEGDRFRIVSLDGHTVAGPFQGRNPAWGPRK